MKGNSRKAVGRKHKDPLYWSRKLLKYVARGSYDKCKSLLRKKRAAVDSLDEDGGTALHQACRHGHKKIVQLLLRHGASFVSRDANGDTPAHAAAANGHVKVVTTLVQESQGLLDLSTRNAAGESVTDLLRRRVHAGVQPRVPASARDEEGEWRTRLAEENSDMEEGLEAPWGSGGSWRGPDWQWAHVESTWAAAEGADEWADRIWREMHQRRQAQRQEQAAARPFVASAAAAATAAAERERRAEHARSESERILKEERAREQQRQRAALVKSAESSRVAYESAWARLESLPAGQAVGLRDLPELPVAGGTTAVAEVLLGAAQGPADVKRVLRAEMLRWHPDKFAARWAARAPPSERPRLVAAAGAVAAVLLELLTGTR